MGLLDMNDPDAMSQLALSMGLLTAKQGQPWPALIAQYAQSVQQRREQALRDQLLQQQLQGGGLALKTQQQQFDDNQKARDVLRTGMGPEPQAPVQAPGGGMMTAPQAPGAPGAAVSGVVPGKNQTFTFYKSIGDKMAAQGLPEQAQKYYDLAEKYRPKLKDTKTLTDPNTQQRVTVNFYEDGTHEVVPLAPDQEKAHFADTGGQITPLDPFTGKPRGQGMAKTVSPDTQFTGNVTMRGQNITDARARELNAITKEGNNQRVLETANGPVQIDLRTGTAAPIIDRTAGRAIPGEAQIKREVNAKGVLDLLGDAKQLIPGSTNSMAGAGVDLAARGVGLATGGAKNIAALKTIEGALLAQMPRMEGPQSNYDVQNYKQAAGMLGDPTVPRELKMAAIAEIERIQKRYASTAPQSSGFRYIGKEK